MSQPNEPASTDSTVLENRYEHLRRNPRFKAFDDRQIAVVIQRAPGFEPREVRGRILDLSAGGAKIAAPCEISLQEVIELRFDAPELSGDFAVAANICWARTAGGSTWRLGCSFVKDLPEALLLELAVHGYIDRREDDRQTVSVPAIVQWEVTREKTAVRVQDVSLGGFNVICPQTVAEGTRLRLLLGEAEDTSIAAVVRWQRHAAEGYLLGCSFLEAGAHQRLDKVLKEAAGAMPARSVTERPHPTETPLPPLAAEAEAPLARLTVAEAALSAKRRLAAALAAMAGCVALIVVPPDLGPLGWAAPVIAILGAALATASYQRLTLQVMEEAAEAARNGKLC